LAVVFGHIPLHPRISSYDNLLWNYEEVLAVLHGAGNVVLTLAGHTHVATHAVDERGVHHHSLHAPLETKPGLDAFSIARVYADRIELEGHGLNMTAVVPLPSLPEATPATLALSSP
jgi:hypothetical protein